MDTLTRKFTLVSGIEAEVTELFGKHQKILTTKNNMLTGKGVDLVLADCIVRLGSDTDITEAKVKKMLAADRKKALLEIRALSLEYDPTFRFDYEWEEADKTMSKFSYAVDFAEDQFKEDKYKTIQMVDDKDNPGQQVPTLVEIKCAELSELAEFKLVHITLPRSKKVVRFNLLDGEAEGRAAIIPASQRSSHTPLEVRRPQEVIKEKEDGEKIWGSLNLDKLSFQDITYLRNQINELEGGIDSTLVIQHQAEPNREVKLDILTVPAFFFPSALMQ